MTNKDLARFKKQIECWKGSEDCGPEMEQCYAKDRKDLMTVYNFLLVGHVRSAGRVACNLDTIVRDQIPSDIYNYMFDRTLDFC